MECSSRYEWSTFFMPRDVLCAKSRGANNWVFSPFWSSNIVQPSFQWFFQPCQIISKPLFPCFASSKIILSDSKSEPKEAPILAHRPCSCFAYLVISYHRIILCGEKESVFNVSFNKKVRFNPNLLLFRRRWADSPLLRHNSDYFTTIYFFSIIWYLFLSVVFLNQPCWRWEWFEPKRFPSWVRTAQFISQPVRLFQCWYVIFPNESKRPYTNTPASKSSTDKNSFLLTLSLILDEYRLQIMKLMWPHSSGFPKARPF